MKTKLMPILFVARRRKIRQKNDCYLGDIEHRTSNIEHRTSNIDTRRRFARARFQRYRPTKYTRQPWVRIPTHQGIRCLAWRFRHNPVRNYQAVWLSNIFITSWQKIVRELNLTDKSELSPKFRRPTPTLEQTGASPSMRLSLEHTGRRESHKKKQLQDKKPGGPW